MSTPIRWLRRPGLWFVPGLVVVVAAAAAGCGAVAGGGDAGRPAREAPRPSVVGSGARSALLLPARGRRHGPAVVFLHGWGLTGPTAYRSWLRHLTDRGSTVIVPRYQASLRTSPETLPGNLMAGVRAALRRLRPRPRGVVVVGHSVGGILAVDYAARARSLGLPPAVAVMIVYPGGVLRDMPAVPEDDPKRVPSSVRRLLVLASPSDRVVGMAPAQAIFHGSLRLPAARRRIVEIDDPVAGDHFAPVLDSPTARRVFWSRLDRLLALVG